MRRVLLWACVPLLAACAAVMNALEDATPEDTAAGKLVRGANRMRKSFQDLDPSEEHFIGRSVAAQILSMPQYQLADDPKLTAYVERTPSRISATPLRPTSER
jgi:hypothetical protein